MKKLDIFEMEGLEGGGRIGKAYTVACGASIFFLEASFLAGPAVFGANAIFASTCALILPIMAASN
ncbi:hypothetical protein [Runella slithyformis]|uniref:Uncharacterized protein n=1 Tax=Runella slithyformis (strain ATCC 29530 / DSM 19594 / LMG 11500 / NCIMB 11436 / LSU 4) TaxID=761193 RepID=A0A7U3ZNP3_RUNSL|nr:hypothetical protein [Runella slithyformis]AEI50562.1 hypothetical protein Runsl_4218 [Runella slithyformis DSM 19594]